jgi:phage terminase small subunit
VEVSAAQMKALIALLPYVHKKQGEGGKKEQRQSDAKKVAGRFAAAAPPRLAAVGGKKV